MELRQKRLEVLKKERLRRGIKPLCIKFTKEYNMTIPMNLHPQYITDNNGEKMSVILSMEEFENILEDIEDLAIVAERKDEKMISHKDFMDELKQDAIV